MARVGIYIYLCSRVVMYEKIVMLHDENEWLSLLCFKKLVVPYFTPSIHLSFSDEVSLFSIVSFQMM